MTVEPLVSACMITYNHEAYIEQAIKCVLHQKTNFPFELVIGEDCSTDRTREIVFEYQRRYPDIIRVITSEKNVGAHKNLYRTEMACRGKYVAYCEGDDFWHNPDKLQIQVDFLEANPDYGMVYGNFDIVYEGLDKREYSVVRESKELRDGNAYEDILSGKRRSRTLTVCVRRDILFEIVAKNPECTDEKYLMGDAQRWLEISRVSKVRYIDEILATLNALPESATRSRDPRKVLMFNVSRQELALRYLNKYDCPGRVEMKVLCNLRILTLATRLGDVDMGEEAYAELKKHRGKNCFLDKVLLFICRNNKMSFLFPVLAFPYRIFRKVSDTAKRVYVCCKSNTQT